MRIFKYLLVLILASLILFVSSCHGTTRLSNFEVPESFDSEQNYEITFWAKNDSNLTQANIYKQAIADFQEYYPNIKVNLRIYTDYSRIYNDVITNIATDTTPNVCITYPDHIATYLTGENTVVPLDELVHDEQFGLGGSKVDFDAPKYEEITEKFLDECKINGNLYALPFMRSTEACYINRDFVEKLGFALPETLTWDFLFEVADAATKKDENGNFVVNGQKVLIPIIYKSTDNMMIQMLKQKGLGYSDNKGSVLMFNDETAQLLKNISIWTEKGCFSTFKISGYPANFLNAGQCIFAIDSTAGATWMGCEAPLIDISEDNLVNFKTEVMTIPQFDTENPVMISQGPSVCIFNKENSGEVIASWLFVQYLLTNDVQIAYSQTEGYVPVTEKAKNSAEYMDYLTRAGEDNELYYDIKLKATKLLIDNTDNTFVTPVFNGSASLRSAAGQLIENVAKSVKRGENIDDEYVENLYTDITTLYRLENVTSSGLPVASVVLLVSLVVVWCGIIAYVFCQSYSSRKIRKN